MRRGFRGYIGSRPVRGLSYPQRVQNLVVRDYAARHGLRYLLSATEHCMPGSYMVLHDVLAEAAQLDGIILFSLFQLPARKERRLEMYRRLNESGTAVHAALEEMAVAAGAGFERFEDLIAVEAAVRRAPFGGYDDKGAGTAVDRRFRVALLAQRAGPFEKGMPA